MTPTTVKITEYIRNTYELDSSEGNVISQPYLGWSNLYHGYLLGAIGFTAGNPRNGSYMVRSWGPEGEPKWSQPPRKLYDTGLNAIMVPVQDSPESPPFNSIGFLA